MKAELISIGTELLLGDIVNTNAQFLAKGACNFRDRCISSMCYWR